MLAFTRNQNDPSHKIEKPSLYMGGRLENFTHAFIVEPFGELGRTFTNDSFT
jgi:hypothetical protein